MNKELLASHGEHIEKLQEFKEDSIKVHENLKAKDIEIEKDIKSLKKNLDGIKKDLRLTKKASIFSLFLMIGQFADGNKEMILSIGLKLVEGLLSMVSVDSFANF